MAKVEKSEKGKGGKRWSRLFGCERTFFILNGSSNKKVHRIGFFSFFFFLLQSVWEWRSRLIEFQENKRNISPKKHKICLSFSLFLFLSATFKVFLGILKTLGTTRYLIFNFDVFYHSYRDSNRWPYKRHPWSSGYGMRFVS